jgi:exo-1,4-beta-D-glucosaminidase
MNGFSRIVGIRNPREISAKLGRLALLASMIVSFSALTDPLTAQTVLREGWRVQSSAKVSNSGDRISELGFSTQGWYQTVAPKTVFAVLVENGVYKVPYYGMNLRTFPGVEYKIGSQFANVEMPADSPYAVSWWYRKEFTLPKDFAGKTVWLNFRGPHLVFTL